jgi:hypothetical protein
MAVIDNKVIVSHAPDLIVYTDVDGDGKFDPRVDRRDVSNSMRPNESGIVDRVMVSSSAINRRIVLPMQLTFHRSRKLLPINVEKR